MLIRATQVRRFADPCAAALGIAAERLRCDEDELAVVLLGNGDREVTRYPYMDDKIEAEILAELDEEAAMDATIEEYENNV